MKHKRFLALLLALCLVVSFAPAFTLQTQAAVNSEVDEEIREILSELEEVVKNSDIKEVQKLAQTMINTLSDKLNDSSFTHDELNAAYAEFEIERRIIEFQSAYGGEQASTEMQILATRVATAARAAESITEKQEILDKGELEAVHQIAEELLAELRRDADDEGISDTQRRTLAADCAQKLTVFIDDWTIAVDKYVEKMEEVRSKNDVLGEYRYISPQGTS